MNSLVAKSYFLRKNYAECIPYCARIIYIIESYDYLNALEIQCDALKMRSSCEMAIKNYKDALTTLKFLLESAFRGKDSVSEIFVYEKLALCHFYLGELDRAKYYLVKMIRGLVEPEHSEIRVIYKTLRLNYQIAKNGGQEMHKILEKEERVKTIFQTFY